MLSVVRAFNVNCGCCAMNTPTKLSLLQKSARNVPPTTPFKRTGGKKPFRFDFETSKDKLIKLRACSVNMKQNVKLYDQILVCARFGKEVAWFACQFGDLNA